MLDGLLVGGVVMLMAKTLEPNFAFLLTLGLFSSYHIGFAALFGATPGKMLLNLRIVAEEGNKINTLRAVSRFCIQVIHFPFLGLGYLLILFSPKKRALHNMICRTHVIYSKL